MERSADVSVNVGPFHYLIRTFVPLAYRRRTFEEVNRANCTAQDAPTLAMPERFRLVEVTLKCFTFAMARIQQGGPWSWNGALKTSIA
jgi:hypothetical protein